MNSFMHNVSLNFSSLKIDSMQFWKYVEFYFLLNIVRKFR